MISTAFWRAGAYVGRRREYGKRAENAGKTPNTITYLSERGTAFVAASQCSASRPSATAEERRIAALEERGRIGVADDGHRLALDQNAQFTPT